MRNEFWLLSPEFGLRGDFQSVAKELRTLAKELWLSGKILAWGGLEIVTQLEVSSIQRSIPCEAMVPKPPHTTSDSCVWVV